METMATRIESYLAAKNGGNQSEMARFIGVTPQAVQKWIAGVAEPRGKNLEMAAEFLGVTPAELKFGIGAGKPAMGGKGGRGARERDDDPSDVEEAPNIVATPRHIPVAGRVQAGPEGFIHIDDHPPESPEGYMFWYSSCVEAYALRVRGESMSPRYLPGEFVGVDPCAEVLPSDEVIVQLADGRRMIKRLLWMRDGQGCFESVNKDHPNIIIDCAEIQAMHLVLGHIPKAAFRPSV
jgi:phage repressor protein C with HTH and peptisase S24 domain